MHPAGTSAKFAEPFEAWEDAVISRVLQVTLNVSVLSQVGSVGDNQLTLAWYAQREQAEASNWFLAYLKEAEHELLDENKGPSFRRCQSCRHLTCGI